MRIGIDLTYIHKDDVLMFSGIGVFSQQLIHTIKEKTNYDLIIFAREDISLSIKKIFPMYSKVFIDYKSSISYVREYNIQFAGLKKAIQKKKIDVLLTTKLNTYGYVPSRIPYIAVLHDLDFLEKHSIRNVVRNHMIKRKCKNIDYLVVISDFVKNEFIKWNPSYKGNVNVIYNPVYIDDYSKNKRFNKKYILCVNTFLPSKNQITLLKAYRKICCEISHDLIFIGKGPERENCENYVKNNNLNNRVTFLQDLSTDEMRKMFANADLFVSTSRFEGFGRTPIEAALYKIPIITSEETSLREVTMGLLEYYNPGDNYEMLADKMLMFFNGDIEYSNERIENIYNVYKRTYSPYTVADKYIHLINDAIKRNV